MYVTFVGHKTGVNCIAFSKDGLTLATGGKVTSEIFRIMKILIEISCVFFIFSMKLKILPISASDVVVWWSVRHFLVREGPWFEAPGSKSCYD